MYNIHSHYENIFSFLKTIVKDPVLLSFYPFGSTKFENVEYFHCNGDGTSPVIVCYDQEPILDSCVDTFKNIKQMYSPGHDRSIILLNTETNSEVKNQLLKQFKFGDCTYFFHIFAAVDWYRGYQQCADLTVPTKRKINKKFITFNRITGNSRAYRSLFVAELIKNNLLEHGHVSYSENCPEHGHYSTSIYELVEKHNVSADYILECKAILDSIPFPLRIDFKETALIPNGSQTLNAIPEMMESFLHVVTETCFWETKDHLTEKIFKPIVARQPFVLLGCANNLKYLKSYGFKTFDSWWDESYDQIEDPVERIQAIVKIIKYICSMSAEELEAMLQGMNYVLDYNYNLFYSKDFIQREWDNLKQSLIQAVVQHPPRLPGGTPILDHLYISLDNTPVEYRPDKLI
jgi:hypothetical protein